MSKKISELPLYVGAKNPSGDVPISINGTTYRIKPTELGTSKPNKVATVTLSEIGISTTTYTKLDLETAVTAYRQTLPMDVIYDIVVVKNVIV